MKWTVGITTAPRPQGYYLDVTINTLKRAGWSNMTVFAEPNSIVPDDVTVIERRKTYGDWTNWATALYDLLLSEPDTDYFFMSEDDVEICPGAKAYVEYALPKLGEFAFLSLYTSSRYHKPNYFRMFHNECDGIHTWSTITVIMSRSSVIKLFSDEQVQRHRFSDLDLVNTNNFKASFGRGRTSIIDCVGNTVKDSVLGRWASKNNLPIFFHTPSLAEHTGYYSTLTEDVSTVENMRRSKDFVGNLDVSQWVGQKIIVRKRQGISM